MSGHSWRLCTIAEFLLPGHTTAHCTPCRTNSAVKIFTFSLLLYILSFLRHNNILTYSCDSFVILLLCLIYYFSDGFEFGFSLLPFLFEDAVFEEAATSIEMTGVALDVHTTEGHIEMRLVCA